MEKQITETCKSEAMLEDSLKELSQSIKSNLLEISERANIDLNTLWIAFKSEMEELENDFKKEYV